MIPGPLAGVRIAVAVTAPSSASFYAGQLAALGDAGAEVFLLSSPSDEVARQCAEEGAHHLAIEMARSPSPWRDARALAQITATLARLRPDIVNAGTPKAGLLGMIAAATVRVPIRVHTVHGLRYEVASGHQRQIVWAAQRLSCAIATDVVFVGPSLRKRAVATGLIASGSGLVIGDGSVNGVDVARFRRDPDALQAGAALRARFDIAPDAPVVGYLGRLARDKGIGDLARAWRSANEPEWRLLIGGELDDTDPPDPGDVAELRAAAGVRLVGHVADPVAFLAAIDVLVLPTWREGFPTVALEAAALSVPVVATRATGCADAVVDGVTGALVPTCDPVALAAALAGYLTDADRRVRHGNAGRARVVECFRGERIHALTIELYRSLLARR